VVHQVGLRLQDVDEVILQGISFDLEPGEVLGLIGPSGAGKSSLVRLLVGASAPTIGSVRLDGADVEKWPAEQLGTHIGYLPQDVALLSGSVSQNIARFGEIDSEKVIAAARAAGAHELILNLPDEYETQIGLAGRRLSGGQTQRIALARALYGDIRLVVLDEPNSNLDHSGEAALRAAIAELKTAGRTVVIVTHKPSLLAEADKILVLRNGRMAAFGPRDEVLAEFLPVIAHPAQHGLSKGRVNRGSLAAFTDAGAPGTFKPGEDHTG
jgi:ABC-type protease/lipase transport system fused ATPase/permease subunit